MHWFRKTPFVELVACAVIIGFHGLLGSWPRLVSDALFLEGVTLSILGGIILCKIPRSITRPDYSKTNGEGGLQTSSSAGRSLLRAFTKRRNGFRILFVGLVLIGAAVLIGEFFVRLGT